MEQHGHECNRHKHIPEQVQLQQKDRMQKINEIRAQKRELLTNQSIIKGKRNLINQKDQAKPIRITFDTTSLQNLDKNKQELIKNSLEIAKQYFQHMILVHRDEQNIIVKNHSSNNDPGDDGNCLIYNDLNIPENDQKEGVPDSDLHIYVIYKNSNDNYIAYAAPCQYRNYRPLVGYINFNINWLGSVHDQSSSVFEYFVKVTVHELIHCLGFNADGIDTFLIEQEDGTFGLRTQEELNDIKDVNYQWRGKSTLMLKSPNVKRVAQEYFGCDQIEGMIMENEGKDGSKHDHWEKSLQINELMTSTVTQDIPVVSEFTLAYLKDSNWYADIDFSMAESLQWGKGEGCAFFNEICQAKQDFREFPNNQKQQCTFFRNGPGIPTQLNFLDDCEAVSMYDNYDCSDPSDNNQEISDYTSQVYGVDSKCFESDIIKDQYSLENLTSRCYEHICFNNKLYIKISGNLLQCKDGQQLNAPQGYKGTLTCPDDIEQFCNLPRHCEDHCNGKGYCLNKDGNNKCLCMEGYQGKNCEIKCDGECTTEDQCDENMRYDEFTKTCQKCSENCSYSCTGPNESDCTLCENGQLFTADGCKASCPKNTQKNDDNVCLQQELNYLTVESTSNSFKLRFYGMVCSFLIISILM
ncbi:Insulin-like growth factor binding protein, N-terminal [Pseudocohnilembus persalinus]|uniref:Insulin-like growth factor binding protein, N-terminal n=1 Tax=Pseudocohnilembus persalinus TaxID=266149 RepID=A0A0V0QL21_PSEPJ|nr:Insulin-like growth factor binding protein, N-terminal [Pseudocohnilembus persalinus]|eukprot:KRX02932.1 Insulin-like growth factor binding protein, N-terminal [Pseudocohnilembus persalinus]